MSAPGAPAPPRAATYRLLVRSIGTADAAVIGALRRVKPAPDAELAALLYRAPSELLSDLEPDLGARLRDLLRQTGVEVDLVPQAEPFQAGRGDHEVALGIRRYDRMMDVVAETARVLGVPPDEAMKLVCATPAVLLGGVSEATVEALRARFAPLGVEVDGSRPEHARFDVALEISDEPTRRQFDRLLAGIGARSTRTGEERHLVADLDATAARRLWDGLSRSTARLRVLNRDFERFDLRLDHAPATDAVIDWLVDVAGVPRAAAARVPERTPLIVGESLPLARALALIESAGAVGASASAILLPLQSFALRVEPGGPRESSRSWVAAIAGADAAQRFARGATELEGPFTKTQARWLQHELRARGIRAQLRER